MKILRQFRPCEKYGDRFNWRDDQTLESICIIFACIFTEILESGLALYRFKKKFSLNQSYVMVQCAKFIKYIIYWLIDFVEINSDVSTNIFSQFCLI